MLLQVYEELRRVSEDAADIRRRAQPIDLSDNIVNETQSRLTCSRAPGNPRMYHLNPSAHCRVIKASLVIVMEV